MSKVIVNQFGKRTFGGAAGAYGNTTALHFGVQTNASGAVINSNSSAALAIGDVVDLGPLPEGIRLLDSLAIISDALTALVTGSLGFVYEDGTDSTEVPQDTAYFGAGLNLAAAARLRNTTSKAPVVLPKPARLVLTIAGAAVAEAGKVDFVILGELTGPR
ncbi:hypothetical protein M2D07_006600 [Pseudomonas sp. BGr12]|uniref:hypothetical protein n=1 Tax=Pseudomonas sp. BGr12 TaxID=2936269 RepID=UPI00255A1C91|nr:hypothetical protein [Pseudomonas sp. BJa5]MDL2426684.1 hypothetical protein [Pseudomonas sp. BJa5]